ncbi:hypothetical protein VNO77_33431 [Canavalia gladiata]|uniref:Cysteine-rich receptor-like protein kinase 25 n=1 Tax=Canavalia gladiata TaxID=3824 RepID=A0AAN9PXQ3_CANGL
MDASSGNFLLLILISFFTLVTTQSQDNLFFIYQSCSSYDTIGNSVFQLNLKTLLSSLSSNASHSEFYNTTIIGESPKDSVYGLFMCRGDMTPQLCQQCVQNATQRLSSDSDCSFSKQAVIWYDECMVRYSNRSFFSTVDTIPSSYLSNDVYVDKPKSFMRLVFKTMNETADEAARGEKKYATREAKVSEIQTLYCLAQCTPDLSPLHCRTCLNQAIGYLPQCCQGYLGARVLYPSCNVRYEMYPFYRSIVPSPRPTPLFVPASNFSKPDPVYLFHNCTDNKTFIANSPFQLYLTTLLSHLSSKATSVTIFYKESVADTVYGLFMCRGDLSSALCGQCVQNATHRIASQCPFRQEAIIWYSHCLLRYSYRSFFSQVETSPIFSELNITPVSTPTPEQSYFTFALSNTLANLATTTAYSSEKYVTGRLKLSANQTIYTLAQCTQDLPSYYCQQCLEDMIGTAIPWSRLGSVGGRVLYPSCNLRFELFQFYSDHDVGQALSPTPSNTSVPSSGSKVGPESATLESLQFELAVIKTATNNFSNENRIGKGGFGEVYKISDFGLARILEINQDERSTNRIVGTYGYMSPEYAMLGQFSEKSDIFSFGVIILEIIIGKKNLNSYKSHCVVNSLFNHSYNFYYCSRENANEIKAMFIVQVTNHPTDPQANKNTINGGKDNPLS